MADKRTNLEIVISAVDKATAGIRAIKSKIDAIALLAAPIGLVGERLGALAKEAGVPRLIEGFRGVGGAVASVLGRIAMIGGAVGAAVAGVVSLVGEFDDLGDKAEAVGVSVDWLAQMRDAAEKSGSSAQQLDAAMQGFSVSLGLAREGSGKLHAFLLNEASPVLLKQLKAAKSNAEAFDLLANATRKIEDPAKRAAFAQKALGDAGLAPLLYKGADGIKAMRDAFLKSNGSMEGAVEAAGSADASIGRLKTTTTGIKAALVEGLAPALKSIVDRLEAWFASNRENVREFAAGLGKKIPDAVSKLGDAVQWIVGAVKPFVDSTTKLKIIAIAVAAVIAGPLVAAVWSLGAAILATPVGWILAAIAAVAAGAYLLIDNWDAVSEFFVGLWDAVKSKFGWFADVVALLIAPFIYLPAQVIANWDSIKAFFVGLWDGITGAFQKAWEVIEAIVDKVRGAVETVKGAYDTVSGAVGDAVNAVNPFAVNIADVAGQAREAAMAQRQALDARLSVDFTNAPRGTRVTADPRNTADVDMSVGWQMGLSP